MLQHTGMEVFDHSSKCRISCTILDIGYLWLKNTQYPIFLKIFQYEEPDTDIITAELSNVLPAVFRWS